MKILTVVVLALFLAFGLCAQQPPDGKPASVAAGSPQNSGASSVPGNVEVLSDTQGIDFLPYASKVSEKVRRKWYTLIPAQARFPELKSGTVSIEFDVLRDGHVAGMKVAAPSGDIELDQAALESITASAPFAPLPEQYRGPHLALRFHFHYNPKKEAAEGPTKDAAH